MAEWFELSDADRAVLEAAKELGYLWSERSTPYRIDLAWAEWCREQRRPCVFVHPHERLRNRVDVEVSTPPGLRISPLGHDELEMLLRHFLPRQAGTSYDSHHLGFGPVTLRGLQAILPPLLALVAKDQTEKRRVELQEMRHGPVEGMATCVDNRGLEEVMQVGDTCYVREIPNLRGHCVILRSGQPPVVGWHLERFELHEDYD